MAYIFGRLPAGTFTPTLVVLSVQRFIYCFEYILAQYVIANFELLLCAINYGSFYHYKCTTTWLGILCSNIHRHKHFDRIASIMYHLYLFKPSEKLRFMTT